MKKQTKRLIEIPDLEAVGRRAYETAVANGFHHAPVPLATYIENTHEEITELWRAYRKSQLLEPSDKLPELNNAEEELADVLIYAASMHYQIANAVGAAEGFTEVETVQPINEADLTAYVFKDVDYVFSYQLLNARKHLTELYESTYGPDEQCDCLKDLIRWTYGMAVRLDADLPKAVELKLKYNETRPHKHGGRKV